MKHFDGDQNFRVLDLNLQYFMMESMDFPSSEPLNYYPDNSGSGIWQYDSSGTFSSDLMIPSDFGPSEGVWSSMDVRQGSSPSSDECSMGRAPSSNTSYESYNDIENVDPFPENPSPRSPLLGMQAESPISIFPSTIPRVESNPLLDLSGLIAPTLAPNSSITAEPVTCPEGCEKKTFGRQYELDRHIREQHRCPHEDCTDIRFSTPQEKRDHDKRHSEAGLGYRCGTCLLNGVFPKSLGRGEKLKKHFKDQHHTREDFDFRSFQCMEEACYLSKTFGGIFFASERELQEHKKQEHAKFPALSGASEHRESAYSSTPYGSLPVLGTCNGKRPRNCASESDAKRSKPKRVDSTMTSPALHQQATFAPRAAPLNQPSERASGHRGKEMPMSDSTQRIESSASGANLRSNPSPSNEHEESLSLSIMELRALTKHQSWKSLIADLQARGISPAFDSKEAAIRVRGSRPEEMTKGKERLESLIRSVRVSMPDNFPSDVVIRTNPQTAFHQQVSVRSQPEILALDPMEDADVLSFWNDHLLARFPSIVRGARIEGSYSVALVRQKLPEGTFPVIRFRSSGNQSEASRKMIRAGVEDICVKHANPPLHVQFTEGSLVRLARGSLSASIPDDPSSDQRFPHHRRPWGMPGLSASIGLSGCPHVSATSGGYISVDNRMYMLTVAHFISECQCSITNEVRSPSISDILNVKYHLRKKLQELSRRIERSAPQEISLDQVEEILFPEAVDEELEQYKRFEQELDGGDNEFAFGRVRWSCGGIQMPLRQSANPLSRGASHRMDWSVTEVTARHRIGKNTHRYPRRAEPRVEDLQMEVIRPEGTGDSCTLTDDVTGGERVYYVGTTSGLREGSINPALVLYEDAYGNKSHEWAMVVPDCAQLRPSDFQGDSGAWVLSNDNRLLGLLWGWDNGNILFTPIHDVFADITQKMGAHLIGLPEYSGPHSEHQVSLLARITTDTILENSPVRADEPAELPVPSVNLLSPTKEKSRRRCSSGASSTCSIASTPSLLSSASSFVDEGSPQVHTPQDSIPPPLSEAHHSNMELPIRTKPRNDSSVEAAEGWVCIQPDGDVINAKLSALQLASEISSTHAPLNRT